MAAKDDEEAEALGAGMYPIMPSLVGLQQMRNRLHLAQLGRKLMKWTAMATGREMRKIAMDMNQTYDSFGEDLREGFIELARCRYNDSTFNPMVLEDINYKAAVTVNTSVKTVSGVKVINFEIVENAKEAYPYISMAKSTHVKKAKMIWRNLLLRMIVMLQLRESFASVEAANKSATKRQNVLAKVVIPKTQNTIKYILLQLEELAREELFRIKKIKQKKEQKKLKPKKKFECPICKDMYWTNPTVNRCLWCGAWIGIWDQPKKQIVSHKEDDNELTVIKKPEEAKELSSWPSGQISKKPSKTVSITEPRKRREGKIPEDLEIFNLCPNCMNLYEETYCMLIFKKLEAKLSEPEKKEDESDTTPQNLDDGEISNSPSAKDHEDIEEIAYKPDDDMDNIEMPAFGNDLELGTFEVEVKEVIKIVRKKTADGNIVEERKVIRVEREVRNPSKSKKSKPWVLYQSTIANNPYDKLNKGTFAINAPIHSQFKISQDLVDMVKSEQLQEFERMFDPFVRGCMSSAITSDCRFQEISANENRNTEENRSFYSETEELLSSNQLSYFPSTSTDIHDDLSGLHDIRNEFIDSRETKYELSGSHDVTNKFSGSHDIKNEISGSQDIGSQNEFNGSQLTLSKIEYLLSEKNNLETINLMSISNIINYIVENVFSVVEKKRN